MTRATSGGEVKNLSTEQLFGHLMLRLQNERDRLERGAGARDLSICLTHVEDAFFRYHAHANETLDLTNGAPA